MKFVVNGNEVEVYKDSWSRYNYYKTIGNYYSIVIVTLADYTVKVLENDLGLALSNIDSIDKFKEFVNTYDNLYKELARDLRIKEKEEEEQRLLDQEIELENYIKCMESREQEE